MNPLLFLQLLGPLMGGITSQAQNQADTSPAKSTVPAIDADTIKTIVSAIATTQQPQPLPEVKMPKAASFIAAMIVLGFFSVLAALGFLLALHYEPNPILYAGFGSLLTLTTVVVFFYFGSSWGSRQKDVFTRPDTGSVVPVPLPVSPPSKEPEQPKPPPVASGPFDNAPPWFKWALHEIGTHEEPSNRGPAIERYIALAHAGSVGDPWCAIFACAALESVGVRSPRSAASQSFRSDPNFVQLSGPALGAIAVFWRGSKDSGLGHVGFYRGEDATRVWVLGGNEDDMVQIEALPKLSSSFGLIGYWWPKSVSVPKVGAILMPSGSATSITTDPTKGDDAPKEGVQTNIIATMFATPDDSVASSTSAYTGKKINGDEPGVALPYRFSGARPKVRVYNRKAGLKVDADIVDVGPWNTNDPYWESGKRPQAESGVDTRGRRTNGAGIDLTLGAARAIKIDGKGVVDWEFISEPQVT